MISQCETCSYADWDGGDYCDGFGGCYTPEYVSNCKCKDCMHIELEDLFDMADKCQCPYYKKGELDEV